jgi:putative hydrolase of the HAD superfamily
VGRLTPPDPASLDAVTIDANGTLVALRDPTPALGAALAGVGVERTPDAVAAAFAAEGRYYLPRSLEGRDPPSLARLRAACAGVFLSALDAEVDPGTFADAYVAALRFDVLPGVRTALDGFRARGLALAVVANWDVGLHDHLRELELAPYFDVVVTSAEAGAAKPDPRGFSLALERLGVAPGRALHIGDAEPDREGAEAAGLAFAWAPLAGVVAAWP